jgi:hypothetical protein
MSPDGMSRTGVQKRLTSSTEGFRRVLLILEGRYPRKRPPASGRELLATARATPRNGETDR